MDMKRTEMVFGLVGAVGTDFDYVMEILRAKFEEIGYRIEEIRLSVLIEKHIEQLEKQESEFDFEIKKADECSRIDSLMKAGNKLCEYYTKSDAISVLAIREINERRKNTEASEGNVVYILRSLKRSEEVFSLRQTYGTGFFLLGVYSSHEKRKESLAGHIARTRHKSSREDYYSEAETLILRDQKEPQKYGQEVSKTFHLADVFISIEDKAKVKKKIERFVELVFGNAFHTPTREEYAMFFAQAAALRSGALARQVGAAIATKNGEVLAVGTNDVPCSGGGLYWVESNNDQRDHVLGEDSNTKHINILINGIIEDLEDNKLIKNENKKNVGEVLKKNNYLKNITEYGRIVHAEMDAITQAVRMGMIIKNAFLYTTLFPCHNCTKHILAAGIKKVIYIEPYPKSLARELHDDSISIEKEANEEKVSFVPFEGVGPRRYLDLFSLVTTTGINMERKEKGTGKIKKWVPTKARPRLPMSPSSYLEEEKMRIKDLKKI